MIVAALHAGEGNGPPPPEAVEVMVMERFSWTQAEFDDCDMARLWRGMTLLDTVRAAKRHRDGGRLSDGDWRILGAALKAELDLQATTPNKDAWKFARSLKGDE
jgi:hypothetical protein